MVKLPKIFINKINMNNNEKVYYSHLNEIDNGNLKPEEKNKIMYNSEINILKKINGIINSLKYLYKVDVILTINNEKVSKTIIGKNKKYLITMENELILINDIKDIEIVKK